ncbi:MAG TPA: sugar phosphate isomerase/epimerase [Gemmataceae bacterium]|jgi:sugar phosphate isomerase/epimerase|nr:sugar phosphate isomerase/epimerase [Gemmataceae bacterium]
MKPCISEATTMPGSFAEDVVAFAGAGFEGMEVWLTKLEKHLETHSPAATQRLLHDHNVTLAAASYQGGLLLSQGEQRKAHFDDFRRRLDLCQQFGIPTLLVVADFVDALDETSLGRAVVSLRQAAQWAAGSDVRLALEFRGKATFCSSLDTAVALVEQCREPNVGVTLDVFHYYTGPSKFEDLALLTPANLAFVQICDLAGVPRELATDADRVLPGDGDFQLGAILQQLQRIGYGGWVSLELMNPTLWNTPASQVAAIAYQAMQRLPLTVSSQ